MMGFLGSESENDGNPLLPIPEAVLRNVWELKTRNTKVQAIFGAVFHDGGSDAVNRVRRHVRIWHHRHRGNFDLLGVVEFSW